MKSLLLTLSLSIIMTGTLFISCQSSITKEHNENSESALKDSVKLQNQKAAFQKFISESENRMNIYDHKIAELKIKIADEKKAEKAAYEKKLVGLEQKNKALKAKFLDYKNNQNQGWDKKQNELRKDLDDLDDTLARFFVKDI